jgi:ribosomal protein S18 acetylase RimI-like enzyme
MQVIECGGAIAGLLETSEREDAVFVDNIALGEGFRGHGLGRRVLEDVIAGAGARGLAVELTVLHVNPARRLYERLGFAEIGRTEVRALMARPAPAARR